MSKPHSNKQASDGSRERVVEQRNAKVLDADSAGVTVEVYDRAFHGTIDGDRFVHDSYEDWKILQCLKGKQEWLEHIWDLTREKQIRQWNFAGLKAGESILEVGFRDGFNLVHLKNEGVKPVGIEVNPDAVTHALKLGLEVYEEDIQKRTRFSEGFFDVVSACDVLEHCYAPRSALKEMHRILKDDGRLVIEIPFESEFGNNVVHGHSFLYHDDETSTAIFAECGFKVVNKDLSDPKRNIYLLVKA